MAKVIKVYVVRDTATGLYFEGRLDGPAGNAICTAKGQNAAPEYDEDDMRENFPDGLPAGWEAIKVMEFVSKRK